MDLRDINMPVSTPGDETAQPDTPPGRKKFYEDFLTRITACKLYRRKLVSGWTINIDYRRGKPFASQTDEDRIVVNLDWALTKAKQASLFSQIPQIHVDHPPQTLTAGPWVYNFEQRLNDTVVTAGIEAAMDECIVDCINAAGIGVVLVAHESITEDKEVPAIDLSTLPPQVGAQILQTGRMPDGTPVPTEVVPHIIDHRYTINRISPADFLWPINFNGSDFDQAPWIGRSGRVSWAQAVQQFKLQESDRDSILGEERSTLDRLTHDIDKDKTIADEMVGFDEIFYREYQYDEAAKSYTAIHRMVFVTGKDTPVIDESWKGQEVINGQMSGATRFPIRVLTLAYLTDETIPPSDSAIGRPQVNEINKSRTQMILQRERSLPMRTVDVNRIDPTILQNLMRGTWQNIIPVQGNGQNVLTEVSRATHPQENFAFDKIAKSDLGELWQVGANQQGSGEGVETKGEAEIIQSDFTTRIGRERAKVSKFFVTISEVVGGLLCLYEPTGTFGEGFDPSVSKTLSYSILADSTVLVDSNQRLSRLINFVNFAGKTGWIDIAPVLKEIATLSGLDPNTVVRPPDPKPPVEPNISLRLSGTEDLMNPMTLAFLMKSGQAPPPELIEQAKQLIVVAATPPPNAMVPRQPPMGPDGQPLPPVGPDQAGGPGEAPPPGSTPPVPPMPLAPGVPHMAVTPPLPPAPGIGQAHPNWQILPKVNKRSDEN